MTTTTTVYQVTTYDGMIRHYHFGTKGEAQDFVRGWRKENDSEKVYEVPSIHSLVVPLNARGIAQALDDFVSYTCANEG